MYEIEYKKDEGLIVKYNNQYLEGVVAVKVDSEIMHTIKPTKVQIIADTKLPTNGCSR